MPHSRSPSKLAAGRPLVVEGDVCRESNVAQLLINRRWMQLFGPSTGGGGAAAAPPLLASYRHRSDAEPSKAWEITKNCSVTEVARGTFHLRSDTTTLVAVVAAKFTEVQMVREGCCCLGLLHGVLRLVCWVLCCAGGCGTGSCARCCTGYCAVH